ncbi:MAG TPA: hypothetical protein ENJ95_07825 [Bacteroidetes bacterium]|nr:hypothetical protein [Bacteroidota bacterium]
MTKEFQYMVDFKLPQLLSEDFLKLIPQQRSKIDKLFREGKLINYALSLDHSKMWAVVSANNETEVKDLLFELPLTRFMDFNINMLTLYNAVNGESPVFSLN